MNASLFYNNVLFEYILRAAWYNSFFWAFLEVRVWDNFFRVFIICTCDSRSFLGS
jgi:hypothetical protein